ncbi:MAG: dihydrodipicolinate synthase family protein [Bacteroidales bacterium]|nr:dihydrodipicolinate synthase family protein [Bacteroidales bacterium]
MISLQGIFPPLPTAFDSRQALSTDKMQENIRYLSRYDLTGFLVLGSNGELVNLTYQEKCRVYQKCREAIPGDKLMLAGTGHQSTYETIQACQDAARAGADAVLVLNPSYYKGLMDRKALTQHYWAVADASPVPLIIYNMPANSGLDMDADTICELSTHENVIGLKDSGGNMVKMGTIIDRVQGDFQVLAGSAGFLLPGLSLGARGGILALANIAPGLCLDIYRYFMDGHLEAARKEQLNAIPLNTSVTRQWGVPALKEAMDHLGLYGGPPRRPLLPVDSEVQSTLHRLISELDIHL